MNKRKNHCLLNAKKVKNNEFYTRYEDIESEIKHYYPYLKDKTIYTNTDNPYSSNFYKYFKDHFKQLGLKQLIATNYSLSRKAYKAVYDGKTEIVENLKGNGDFRSGECLEILEKSDIVVTNPPFSLFRKFVGTLLNHHKQFLIIGNLNAVTFKEFFPYIKNQKVWTGYNHPNRFLKCDGITLNPKQFNNLCWYTNIGNIKEVPFLKLNVTYDPILYQRYDNYNAIHIKRIRDIPDNYSGIMGVPVNFIEKWNPKQFIMLGIDRYVPDNPNYGHRFTINGKETYARLLIKKGSDINITTQH